MCIGIALVFSSIVTWLTRIWGSNFPSHHSEGFFFFWLLASFATICYLSPKLQLLMPNHFRFCDWCVVCYTDTVKFLRTRLRCQLLLQHQTVFWQWQYPYGRRVKTSQFNESWVNHKSQRSTDTHSIELAWYMIASGIYSHILPEHFCIDYDSQW